MNVLFAGFVFLGFSSAAFGATYTTCTGGHICLGQQTAFFFKPNVQACADAAAAQSIPYVSIDGSGWCVGITATSCVPANGPAYTTYAVGTNTCGGAPTVMPTKPPTAAPSVNPTFAPSRVPTTIIPSAAPTVVQLPILRLFQLIFLQRIHRLHPLQFHQGFRLLLLVPFLLLNQLMFRLSFLLLNQLEYLLQFLLLFLVLFLLSLQRIVRPKLLRPLPLWFHPRCPLLFPPEFLQ
jgi:hypothetical protein